MSSQATGDSLEPAVRALSVVCIFLTTTFTAARLITKKSISTFHVEDYLSIVAWMAANGDFIVIQFQANDGLGQHIFAQSTHKGNNKSLLGFISSIFYCLSLGFAKGALLFQLQRIFSPHKRGLVWVVTQILVWINVAAYLGCLVAVIAQCTPVQKLWTPSIKEGKCINFFTILIAAGGVNVASDALILFLPIWAIYHLNIPMKKKVPAFAMFSTGGLSFISSICRLIYSVPLPYSKDITYDLAKVVLWTFGEITSIIMCTCLPLMPRFIQIITGKCKGSFLSTIFRSKTDSHAGMHKTSSSGSSCACEKKGVACSIHEISSGDSQIDKQEIHADKYQPRKSSDGTFVDTNRTVQDPEKQTMAESTTKNPYSIEQGQILVQQDFHVEHGVRSDSIEEAQKNSRPYS